MICVRLLNACCHIFPVSGLTLHINFIQECIVPLPFQHNTYNIYYTPTGVAQTPQLRNWRVYTLVLATGLNASSNRSWYLSSSSACPPALEVLCIDGKPSDTPSSIDPDKRKKEKSPQYLSNVLDHKIEVVIFDGVRLIYCSSLKAIGYKHTALLKRSSKCWREIKGVSIFFLFTAGQKTHT